MPNEIYTIKGDWQISNRIVLKTLNIASVIILMNGLDS